MNDSSRNDRLADLARRLLDGEAIDWNKEGIAESEVRDGMKRLERIVGHADRAAETETAPPPTRDRSDRFIGDFRIVRKLGEGGMGVVYEAEQQHPKRPVALKVIRGGAHVSPDTLKLFRREIQTLARLNHSGIAQLYEAGVTDDGMHFFAMELVRGVPVSDWLRSRPKGPMTPAELRLRLGLFRKICDAVAYAHQKGVIHRDLKPGNVLIPKPVAGSSMADAVPEIKILDFGLARITDSDVQATTFITEMGKVQGTLPYMSPEQVRGNPDEIDLRTDVYALGVMLYEMVTGRLPYDISKAQIPEAVRIICEDPPRSLTSTFSGTRRLDADIATIAGKCLEKESARRYQSAAALGEDVQRYLTDRPILARRPSAAYQFRKLVSRHKGPFAAAAAAFVLLAVFATAMTIQAARIAKERDRASQSATQATEEAAAARAVSDFLEEMFAKADPSASRGAKITAREVLDKAAQRIAESMAGQPLIQARLMSTMARVFQRLGLPNEAEQLFEKVVEIQRREIGESSPDYARSLNALGWSMNNNGDYMWVGDRAAEALPLHEKALRILERSLGPEDPDVGWSYYFLGHVNPSGDGCRQYEQALRIFEKDPERNWKGMTWVIQELGNCAGSRGLNLIGLGDAAGGTKMLATAVDLVQRALTISEKHNPPDSYDLSPYLANLGAWLARSGRFAEAAAAHLRALTILESAGLADENPIVYITLVSVGVDLTGLGKYDEAREYLERALSTSERAQGTPLGKWIPAHHAVQNLAELEQACGRFAAAESLYLRAIRLREQVLDEVSGLSESLEHYASLLRQMGRASEATKIDARARQIRAGSPR